MRLSRLLPSLVLLAPTAARAQPAAPLAPAPAEVAAAMEPPPVASTPEEAPLEGEASVPPRVFVDAAHRSGFTSGLRLGAGLPIGAAGRDALDAERTLSDLAPWRAPVWVDVGYSLGALTLGVYAQVGVGGTGDACLADCDWSDIRFGISGELRLAHGAVVDPWIGLGLGYEALSYRTLFSATVTDDMGQASTVSVRATERFVGPELLVHGGLDFQVEDALRVGPFAALSLGQYTSDSYDCTPDNPACPSGSSVDGGALHGWISFGVRGAYTP
jgi:hypothetical protein